MLEIFPENRQFTAQITDQRRLDSSARHPLGQKVLFAPETRCSTSRKFQRKPPTISTKVFGVCGLHQVLPYLFPGKKKGNSIFWFRWRNMAFDPSFLFLPFAIFFGSTAFHIPFLDSTSAPLTAGEPLNRWVLRGLAVSWLGSFVRNKKCSRNEVKLSHAVELFYRFGGICCFIGEVFVLRSPLTHFDTESNIIIEPNA